MDKQNTTFVKNQIPNKKVKEIMRYTGGHRASPFSLNAVNVNGYKSNFFEHPWYYHVLDMSNLENNSHIN